MPTATAATLKAARERKKLTQKEVAILAFQDEESQSLVSRYEAGLIEPKLPTLRKLAPVLDLDLGDFKADDPSPDASSPMPAAEGM